MLFNSTTPTIRPETRVPHPYLGKCQLCHAQGHIVKWCPQLQSLESSPNSLPIGPFTLWQPWANLAVASPYTANNWLLDSGALHHITINLKTLSLHQPCNSGDNMLIYNGSTLPITHIDSTLLPIQSRDLALHKVLYDSDIHKNLICVYRLCNTNHVLVEFFSASF